VPTPEIEVLIRISMRTRLVPARAFIRTDAAMVENFLNFLRIWIFLPIAPHNCRR
jgi:hypothetical protein